MIKRLTKRDNDGQAMMDCEKCKADWTGKNGKPMVDCTALYCKGEDWLTACEVAQQSCLTLKDMHDYLHAQTGYGWHITDLRIYDAPKCLLSFGRKGFADASQASSGAENVAIAISARRRAGAMWR